MSAPVTDRARGGQATPRFRDVITTGTLLFAPVLLIFPLRTMGATVGWLLGLTLLWSSTRWNRRDKILATLVWPGGLAPALTLATTVGEVCERTAGGPEVCSGTTLPTWLGVPVLVLSVVPPVAVAAMLLGRPSAPRPSP